MHFQSLLSRIQVPYPFPLPVLQDGSVEGVRCEDHLTFVVPPAGKDKFIEFWKDFAFKLSFRQQEWETIEFPATHIALTQDGEVSNCADMIGASVPNERQSPIYKAFELYGDHCTVDTDCFDITIPGLPQHLAYSLDARCPFEDARAAIRALGYEHFTPVLEYVDKDGAILRQSFFGCQIPYGPFGELIQRVPSPGTNEPFKGFSPRQIDDLYRYYVAHSEALRR